jgi:hypothetical protein
VENAEEHSSDENAKFESSPISEVDTVEIAESMTSALEHLRLGSLKSDLLIPRNEL